MILNAGGGYVVISARYTKTEDREFSTATFPFGEVRRKRGRKIYDLRKTLIIPIHKA